MQIFEYRGRNRRGELMTGTIDSLNAQNVAKWLLASGISPIDIRLRKNARQSQPEWLLALQPGPLVKHDELLLFTRQMGAMTRAGVPMSQVLSSIQESTANPVLAEVVRQLGDWLEKGQALSVAMAQHPKVFDDYYVNMVKVGEGTGMLDEVFARLFEQLHADKNMRQKIKTALRYPTFVVVAIVAAASILTVFVIPIFAQLFANMKMELPLLTRVLLGTSALVIGYWWLIIAGAATVWSGVGLLLRQPRWRYEWDRLKLRLPIVGSIIRKASLARFFRSMATALKAGVPVIQAFTLVGRVVDNAFYEERILGMRDGVERGENLLRVAKSTGIFAPLELQMISVGEQTGDIDGMLAQVADIYQQEVEYEASRLSATIEPVLLVVMGVLVGILLLGIFEPMWNMTQMAHRRG